MEGMEGGGRGGRRSGGDLIDVDDLLESSESDLSAERRGQQETHHQSVVGELARGGVSSVNELATTTTTTTTTTRNTTPVATFDGVEEVFEDDEEGDVEFEGHSHSHAHGDHTHSHSHGTSGRRRESNRDRDFRERPQRPWWPNTRGKTVAYLSQVPLSSDALGTLLPTAGGTEDGIRLIVSHLLTRTGDKMWEFIIPLILSIISPETLLPAALFGFVTTSARVLLGTGT